VSFVLFVCLKQKEKKKVFQRTGKTPPL